MCEILVSKILLQLEKECDSKTLQKIKTVLDVELGDCNITLKTKEITVYDGIPNIDKMFLMNQKLKGCSDLTLKTYSIVLKKFFEFVKIIPEKVTVAHVRRYLIELNLRKLKLSTIDSHITAIRSFYTWATKNGIVDKSPMDLIEPLRYNKKIRKHLTLEELELCRMNCEGVRNRALLEFAYSTGCRVSEIQKTNLADINWVTGSLIVTGKGDKERIVFLNAKAKVYLQEYLLLRKDSNPALFTINQNPHGRMSIRAIQETFDKIGIDSKIGKKIYVHLLRHTMASHMINNGASISSIQKILGHSSSATTEIYSKLNTEEIQRSHSLHLT